MLSDFPVFHTENLQSLTIPYQLAYGNTRGNCLVKVLRSTSSKGHNVQEIVRISFSNTHSKGFFYLAYLLSYNHFILFIVQLISL